MIIKNNITQGNKANGNQIGIVTIHQETVINPANFNTVKIKNNVGIIFTMMHVSMEFPMH